MRRILLPQIAVQAVVNEPQDFTKVSFKSPLTLSPHSFLHIEYMAESITASYWNTPYCLQVVSCYGRISLVPSHAGQIANPFSVTK